jgi:hypothetical protein
VPGFPGAHSQGATLDELNGNLKEVIEMLLDDAAPRLESEFVGTHDNGYRFKPVPIIWGRFR